MPTDALNAISDPRLLAFLSVWGNAADGDAVPPRAAIDPLDLVGEGLLPYTWLAERIDGEFVYRVAGEMIQEAIGDTLIGRRIGEIFKPSTAVVIRERWSTVLDTVAVYHNRGLVYSNLNRVSVGERVGLPVSDEHGVVRYIFGATCYRLRSENTSAGGIGDASADSEVATFLPAIEVIEAVRRRSC